MNHIPIGSEFAGHATISIGAHKVLDNLPNAAKTKLVSDQLLDDLSVIHDKLVRGLKTH